MTAVLFTIAMVVAALGIPGVLPWLQHRASRPVPAQSRRMSVDPPPGPLPIPPLVVYSCYDPDVMVEEFKANYRASRNARNGGGGRGGEVGPGKGRPG
jgi:hypothetical protein